MYSRTKRYYIKEISRDGLIKDPMNSWGETTFNAWGYTSEEEAWSAIENEWQYTWGDLTGSSLGRTIEFVVFEAWVVSKE
jgi:hypothetical protein